jgi:hypothetical protein
MSDTHFITRFPVVFAKLEACVLNVTSLCCTAIEIISARNIQTKSSPITLDGS